LVFASDAGSFAALSGEYVGVTGVLVPPTQVVLQSGCEHGVAAVIRAADRERAQRPELGLGLAHEALVGVKHSSTLCRFAHARIGAVLFAEGCRG
jgi:hypothetical protein